MSDGHRVPDATQVKELLGLMYDGLTVKPGMKLEASARSTTYFGVYVTADTQPGALCGCDMAFAAYSSAALSMLPPNAAKDSARGRKLPPEMLENLHEVMNICTRLMLRDDTAHLKLEGVSTFSALSAPAAALLAGARRRADFEIGFARYGAGLLTVMYL